MAERLIIQNFAGLDVDIELGNINIFIGPQASGKSVCVKCAACFQGFVDGLIGYATTGSTRPEFETAFTEYFASVFAIADTEDNYLFRYIIGKEFIDIRNSKQGIHLTYSKFYVDFFAKLRKAFSQLVAPGVLGELVSYQLATPFLDEARQQLNAFVGAQHLFVPTNRAHFSLLRQTGRNPLSTISDDPLSSSFQSFYHFLKKQQSRRRHKSFPFHNSNRIVARLINQILRATLTKEEKEDVLVHQNGVRTSLRQASSGQQEALPLLLALEYLVGATTPKMASVLYVEEPETHLHPEAQRDLAQLMAAVYNVRQQPLQLFLTTHTPYLLSAFNNLIYAGQLAERLKKTDSAGRKKLYAAVPKELHMKLEDFRVYGLENGKATPLIDEEFGLLMAHSLDSVSDVIADQFGALMELDPANKPASAKQ